MGITNRLLKIVVILLLAVLLFQLIFSGGFENCDKCRFEYKNKIIHTSQIIDIYERECFYKEINESLIFNQFP